MRIAGPTTDTPPIDRALRPFQEFARKESASGVLLLACAAVALVWANSPLAGTYARLWQFPITISVGEFTIRETLHHWINDGLMAVFFLMVGLEIKREALVGGLASPRRAVLPLAGAVGGMVLPALLYAAVNRSGPGLPGWGIPMATDIAFALGVLALLGPRVPLALKIYLAALAIVDDIGAVLVIAFFYTATVHVGALAWAAAALGALFACNMVGVRHPAPYVLLGVALWVALLESGVHATVAGVLLAFTIPARTRIDAHQFLAESREALEAFAAEGVSGTNVLSSRIHQNAIHSLETAAERVQAPLMKFEDALHGVVAFGIMPLFALANAGVPLAGGLVSVIKPIPLGIILGLVVGKPLGITLVTWLAVKARLAEQPSGVSWRALHGVSWLAGIGFTMSLFITDLAFDDPASITQAKLGILAGSLIAGVTGWVLVRQSLRSGR